MKENISEKWAECLVLQWPVRVHSQLTVKQNEERCSVLGLQIPTRRRDRRACHRWSDRSQRTDWRFVGLVRQICSEQSEVSLCWSDSSQRTDGRAEESAEQRKFPTLSQGENDSPSIATRMNKPLNSGCSTSYCKGNTAVFLRYDSRMYRHAPQLL